MKKTERGLYKKRKALIQPLRGKILEVGSGTGINYQFYSDDVELYALDPNASMLKKAMKKARPELSITYLNHGICDNEIERDFNENSLDAIVSTLVLCSVPDPKKAIKLFKYWLKPDGKLVILEHIHAENPINKRLQNILNPVWRPLSDGCNLNRNTDQLLEKIGFISDNTSYFVQSLRWVMGVYKLDDSQ